MSLFHVNVVARNPQDESRETVVTIEGFGVLVDNVGHRFVAQASTVASNC